MMLKTKKIIEHQQELLLEQKLYLIDQVRGETLQGVAIFFRKCDIKVNPDLITFLNNPVGYPGILCNLPLIITKFLKDAISHHYFKIQRVDLQIKFVYDTILKQIFRGKK